MPPVAWWSAFFAGTPLHGAAKRALSILPHSNAVERANSRMAFTHSKARNRLAIQRVRKLLRITSNRVAEEKCKVGLGLGSVEDDEDEEEEKDSSEDEMEESGRELGRV